MQPEPVHKSRTRMGLDGDGALCSLARNEVTKDARRMVHSSVSGRGMSVGGRVKRVRGPKGWVPIKKWIAQQNINKQ